MEIKFSANEVFELLQNRVADLLPVVSPTTKPPKIVKMSIESGYNKLDSITVKVTDEYEN